jgi:hypothetical protein
MGCLLINLVVHGAQQRFVGINNRWNPHGACGLDLPACFVKPGKASWIHCNRSFYTSTIQPALHCPLANCSTRRAV